MPVAPSLHELKYFAAEAARTRAALREQVDTAARDMAERARIAKSVTGGDESLAERIRALGFDGDSARALDLLPLIHIAWADGRIQRGERSAIFRILEERGFPEGHPASLLVASLLEERPSDDYFEQSLLVLRDLLGVDRKRKEDVVDLCVRIADASGGLLGLVGRVSTEERDLIRDVATTLGEPAQARFKGRLG